MKNTITRDVKILGYTFQTTSQISLNQIVHTINEITSSGSGPCRSEIFCDTILYVLLTIINGFFTSIYRVRLRRGDTLTYLALTVWRLFVKKASTWTCNFFFLSVVFLHCSRTVNYTWMPCVMRGGAIGQHVRNTIELKGWCPCSIIDVL